MAEGTGVGSIFLDLIIRDTLDKQIQNLTQKAQQQLTQAFSGMERVAERSSNAVSASAARATEKASNTVAQGINKQVALAQARVKELEQNYERISSKFADAAWSYSDNEDGDKATDKLVERLAAQREAAYDKMVAARERLAIYSQAAAEKEAAAEAAAAQKTTAQREAEAAKQQEAVSQAHTAADPPSEDGQHFSAWEKLASLVSRFKSTASKAFSTVGNAAKGLIGKLSNITKHFSQADKSTSRFATRLKGIVSGALIFNGLSAGLRSMTSYLGTTITSTDRMKEALANLKGAAANAASPIIQVLTPALTALANVAATVFTYVSKLLTLLTGKISNAASTASKSASSAAGAAKKATASLAGFDEIQKLDSNNDSGGGGGDSSDVNYDFGSQSDFLDSILAAVEAGQWEQVGVLIAQKLNDSLEKISWPNIQSKAQAWTQNLVDTLNGFVKGLDWGLLGSTIGNGINTALVVVDTFFQGFDWTRLGKGLGTGLNKLVKTLDWAKLGRVLTDKFKAIFETLHGFVKTFDFSALGFSLAMMFMSGINNIDWNQLLNDICAGIIGLSEMVTEFVRAIDWQGLGNEVRDCLISIDWSGLFVSISTGIGEALGGLAGFLWGVIGDAWHSMMDKWLKNAELCGGDVVAGLLAGIAEALMDIAAWIKANIFDPFINAFKDAFGIHSPSTVMDEQGHYVIEGLLQGITSAWERITKFFDEALSALKSVLSNAWESIKSNASIAWANVKTVIANVVDGIKDKVSTAFTSIKTSVSTIFNNLKTVVANIWNSIASIIKNVINGIIGSINGMISGIVSGINAVIRVLNKLKFTIPSWVPNWGGKSFGFNIGYVSAPQIPMLADGGVITQPTLAMMGEYAGARNNPEIVTPQAIMEETVANAMQELVQSNLQGFEAVVAALKEILEAVLNIEIGDEVIARAVERYNRKMAVARGGA